MEPLNKKEREKAVVDFSLIFGLTVILSVALIVLAFKLPSKINKDTKIKLAKYEQNQRDLEKLVINVDSLVNLINGLKTSGTNRTLNETNINSLLENLQKKSKDLSNPNFKLYEKFAEITSSFKDQIEKSNVGGNATAESEYEKKIATMKRDLNDCQAMVLDLQRTNKQLSQ